MTKHKVDPNHGNKEITGLKVSNTAPAYTGYGDKRVGSTKVTLTFSLSDGTDLTKEEILSDIKTTTTRNFNYTIGYYDVTVRVIVTTTGTNQNVNITGVTAEIINKVIAQ